MPSTRLSPFAEQMLGRRNELGLTQQEVAERAARKGQKVSLATIRSLERGASQVPRKNIRQALAVALDVPAEVAESWATGKPIPSPAPVDEAMLRRIVDERIRAATGQGDQFGDAIRGLSDTEVETLQRLIEMFGEALDAEASRRADEA